MTLIALIIVFASIAWFAMNKRVSGSGMSMTAADTPYELATNEDYISYRSVLDEVDSSYKPGSSVTLKDENGDEGTYYITGSGTQQLILQTEERKNSENVGQGDGNKDVGPDSKGKLNLYIVPKTNDDINVDVKIKVTGYTAVKTPRVDENNQPVTDPETGEQLNDVTLVKTSELNSINTANSQIKASGLSRYVQAANYLKGHIMFFGKEMNADTAGYHYENPGEYSLADGSWTIHYKKSDITANTAYEIPVYWMWPNTLGQIALKNNDNRQRKGKPIVKDVAAGEELSGTDKEKVIEFLKTNKAIVFTNSGELTNDMIQNATANFSTLSTGYNNADLDIGTCVSYFIVEITVDKAS